MSSAPAGYVEVKDRIAAFRAKHPDGCLRPVNPDQPFTIVEIHEATFIAYTAAAYRTPDDPRPGIGTAWEPFPGPTPFTRDSELMNAETSAWGRAIVAVLAADASAGVATREDIQNRQGPPPARAREQVEQPTPSASTRSTAAPSASSDPFRDGWPFGKDKGKALTDVTVNSLKWFLEKYETSNPKYADLDAQRKTAAQAELDRRAQDPVGTLEAMFT
jgi:hypothetical protein